MSQASVSCPSCHAVLAIDARVADGTVLRCPKCGQQFATRSRPAPPPTVRPVQTPVQRPAASVAARPGPSPAPEQGNRLVLYVGGVSCAAIGCALLALVLMMGRRQQPDAVAGATTLAPATVTQANGASSNAVAPGTPPADSQASTTGSAGTTSAAVPTSSAASPATVAPALQPAVAPASPAGLAYRWNPGEEYGYFFTIKAEVAGATDEVTGMTVFTTSTEPAPREFAAHERTGQGSGTGFVIASDGYLVTCAHVVEGSTKIEVILQGRTYPGQVTAFDKKHDLAVVRIAATNLPVLPLANSEAVELAQEVRAVGFPLSNVLGESVKITRGSIAGFVDSAGRKLFQVDASINPGNSGGPIVNEMGQVVGVASSKLAGEDVDGVGLVVPSNEVQSLLRTKSIGFQAAQPATRLEGPELARRVTPAVALLKVNVGPGGYGSVRRSVLKYTGHVTTQRNASPGGQMRMTSQSSERETGNVLVSEMGELVESTGNAQLPYMLGGLGAFPIEPLAPDGEKTWATRRMTVITQVVGDSANDRAAIRFRRRGLRPAPRQQTVVIVPALEAATYELVSTSGDRATIKKNYVFTTLQKEGAPAIAQLTGEGTIVFNQRSGCPETMEYKASLVRSSGNTSVTIPLTLSWRRVSQQVLDDGRARAAAAREAAKNAPKSAAPSGAPANPTAPGSLPVGSIPTAAQVDEALARVGSDDASEQATALNDLDRMKPIDERRAAVTKVAEPLMRNTTSYLRDAAIRVMGTWGTKDNVPALLAMLDQRDPVIRQATIASLGKIPDSRGAEKLAGLVPSNSDRHNAIRALKKMGSEAESAVIKLLKHTDKQVRSDACDILAEWGGAASTAAMQELLRAERESSPRQAAERALKKLTGK